MWLSYAWRRHVSHSEPDRAHRGPPALPAEAETEPSRATFRLRSPDRVTLARVRVREAGRWSVPLLGVEVLPPLRGHDVRRQPQVRACGGRHHQPALRSRVRLRTGGVRP